MMSDVIRGDFIYPILEECGRSRIFLSAKKGNMPLPNPKPMPPWLQTIDTCPSTNRIALDRANDLHHGDAIFTRNQTAGRGQRNRVWHSPAGVITVSFVMQALKPEQHSLLSFSVGLAIIETIETLIPELITVPMLKWPNDVLIHNRKVSGILCEMRSSLPTTIVIGIGLNLAATFDKSVLDSNTNPISLHEVVATVPDDLTVLECLRQCLLRQVTPINSQLDSQSLIRQVRSRDALHGRFIEFEQPNGRRIVGIGRGIHSNGELLIEGTDRQITPHHSGRVIRWK